MTTPFLHIDNLVVRYDAYTAVDHLNLAIEPGELFGLLGPNGAGKSSTIRVLIGQRRPNQGRVTVLGLDFVREWQAIKPLFGYVPDRENHFEEFTGRQNLRFFAELYGVAASRICDCLEVVELAHAADLAVSGYSLGMRRKLLLARALLHRPKLLYLDEPTANLDIHSCEIVHRILRQLTSEGTTVVLTTHNMKEVEKICSRVAILCQGKLVALDTPQALQQQYHQHLVDVQLVNGSRRTYKLDDPAHTGELAEFVRMGLVSQLHTREFDFHQAFLLLTGTPFE